MFILIIILILIVIAISLVVSIAVISWHRAKAYKNIKKNAKRYNEEAKERVWNRIDKQIKKVEKEADELCFRQKNILERPLSKVRSSGKKAKALKNKIYKAIAKCGVVEYNTLKFHFTEKGYTSNQFTVQLRKLREEDEVEFHKSSNTTFYYLKQNQDTSR